MMDPFKIKKQKDPWDNFDYLDDMLVEKDDDLFDHADESLEEIAENEADQGVVGIADWEEWN